MRYNLYLAPFFAKLPIFDSDVKYARSFVLYLYPLPQPPVLYLPLCSFSLCNVPNTCMHSVPDLAVYYDPNVPWV